MTGTKLKFGTALVIVFLVVAFVWNPMGRDGRPLFDDTEDDDKVNVVLEFEGEAVNGPHPFRADIVADLGASGHHERDNARIWKPTDDPDGEVFQYRFRTRRGDRLSASGRSLSGPVINFNCFFHQEGAKGNPDTVNKDGWAEITDQLDGDFAVQARLVATCKAVVR